MRTARWIAIIPAGVLAWYVALMAGMFAASSLDYFCPTEAMVSGLCTAKWHHYAFDTIVVLFAAIAAALIVLAVSWTAPTHKLRVAWIAYFVGCAFATYAVIQTSAYLAFIAALLSGWVAISMLARYVGRSARTGDASTTGSQPTTDAPQ